MNLILKPLLFALCIFASVAQAQSPARASPQESPWINRPWSLRYVLYITDQGGWESAQRVAKKINDEPRSKYFSWESFFSASAFIPIPKKIGTIEKGLTVVPIEFDQNGKVTTPHTSPTPLHGKLTNTLKISLVDGDADKHRQSILGVWFTGLGDVSTHWAPALCDSNEQPDAAQIRSDGYLYGRLFKATPFSKTFGCREWAYQLYDNSRPYIDVTSYVPKDEFYPHGTYIRDFMGWARFGDKKPIIGKHEATWYCLYDCPKGEAPGPIADIQAWASANGWRVPKRPAKSPTFVDPPAKQGTYTQ
jgi:hypothetical protein